jgi:hypothetical protein
MSREWFYFLEIRCPNRKEDKPCDKQNGWNYMKISLGTKKTVRETIAKNKKKATSFR